MFRCHSLELQIILRRRLLGLQHEKPLTDNFIYIEIVPQGK